MRITRAQIEAIYRMFPDGIDVLRNTDLGGNYAIHAEGPFQGQGVLIREDGNAIGISWQSVVNIQLKALEEVTGE